MEPQIILKQPNLEKITNEIAPIPDGVHLPYSTFFGHNYFNFSDANIGRIVEFGANEKELAWLSEMSKLDPACRTYSDEIGSSKLHEIARKILQEETKFDLSKYDLYVGAKGAARGALYDVLARLVTRERPFVAYSSPNWIVFDHIVDNVEGLSNIFFAYSGDSFVDGFKNMPLKDQTAALIAVDPANPLAYRLSERNVHDLEEIAGQNGIAVVFDDVFRGLQTKGQRHSASEYSHNSIVVETTSKRFSARGLGVTWTLVPKSLNLKDIPGLNLECEGCADTAALTIEALYDCGYDSRIQERLKQGFDAFAAGFQFKDETLGNLGIGFKGLPFFTYHVPNNWTSQQRVDVMQGFRNLNMTPGIHLLCRINERINTRLISDKEIALGASFVRICPTKETLERTYFAGSLIKDLIQIALSSH